MRAHESDVNAEVTLLVLARRRETAGFLPETGGKTDLRL
jgi:hypothetical protein